MLARLLRWFAPLVLAVALCLPAAAQAPADPAKTAETRNPPAPQYALAIIAAILVLLIICMPSRKRWG